VTVTADGHIRGVFAACEGVVFASALYEVDSHGGLGEKVTYWDFRPAGDDPYASLDPPEWVAVSRLEQNQAYELRAWSFHKGDWPTERQKRLESATFTTEEILSMAPETVIWINWHDEDEVHRGTLAEFHDNACR
jgi:hypothetical protein